MNKIERMVPPRRPKPYGSLANISILLVEDSNQASDAIRLMCLHSGAKLRRARDLAGALWHLDRSRPDVVIVDLGLPDGSGERLISRIGKRTIDNARPAILGLSGDPDGRERALKAGAGAFLAKPIQHVGAFQMGVLSVLPGAWRKSMPRLQVTTCACDPLACREDLMTAVQLLQNRQNSHYAAQFIRGLAHSIGDGELRSAAQVLLTNTPNAANGQGARENLTQILHTRLACLDEI